MESIIDIFDVGVLSTYGEGISNSIMEYMALKKPVIVTDCGGNRELVKDNHTGFIVEAGNPAQIAEKIFLLLDNNAMAAELGRNGYEKLTKEFSLEVMGNQFLKLYKLLLS